MSGKVHDLTGQRFGRLRVLRFAGTDQRHQAVWHVRCACGRERYAGASRLRNGDLRSCGQHPTHGESVGRGTKEYRTWMAMHARCRRGPTYVKRHIRVCRRWRSFAAFLLDMGRAPADTRRMSIERKNNAKGYTPKNCVWATQQAQCRNKQSNRMVRYKGRRQALSAWAEELGLSYSMLHKRITYKGWSVSRAFTTPARGRS